MTARGASVLVSFGLLASIGSPPLALAAGIGLGFGMNLERVLKVGASGFLYTAAGIAFALALGRALGRLLGVADKPSWLVSVGTAICGGSAIAAAGPVVEAEPEDMSVALAVVFSLNAVGLLVFPPLGHAFGLEPAQFGLWAALAIHDTSSVVGACIKYGGDALAVGAAVKLARALWIVPVCLLLGTLAHGAGKAKAAKPWFILWFLAAAAVATSFPAWRGIWGVFAEIAKSGLTGTLFLIGLGITPETLKKVGARPLLQGVLLWAAVATASLALIRAGWVR